MTNFSSSQPLEPDSEGRPDSTEHNNLTKDSTASGFSKSKNGGRKKRLRIPLSIEELFNKPSTLTAANINPPPGKVVLTPRSAEACLKLGVNPEIIKIRDIDSFWEPSIDPSVQRMRHEAYVQRRYEVMKQLRIERKKLAHIAEYADSKGGAAATGMTPEMILKQQQEQNSSILELEKKRIQKMKERQERELEQMLQYEVNRAKLQQDMEKRIQLQKKKDDMRKKQQQKRMKLMAEESRLRELQKLAMEEAEEAKRRGLARAMYDREQKAIEEAKKKEAADLAHARQCEAERKRKQEEHRMQVARYFAEEQAKLRERMESMQEAEIRKKKAIDEAQRKKKVELRKKRDMVEKRIERNMEMAAAVEAKRKQDFIDKQEKHDQIRQAHLEEMEKAQQLHLKEIEMQEQRRRMIILQQRREEERKKELMLQKFDEDEKHVADIKQMHVHEQKLVKERKMLQIQMKAENVDRVKRMAEYRRLNTLKKIEDNDSRTKAMLDQKEELIARRRETAIKTKRQKEEINNLMEGVRTDANKANKIITMALSGKVDLAELASPNKTKKKKKRSKSSNGRPSQTTSKLLGQSATQSFSAGEQQSGSMDGFKRHDEMDDDQASPSRYVSPYEMSGSTSQKITL